MNLYILVEGKTEAKVYALWLSHLIPRISRVKLACQAKNNDCFLVPSKGYPEILNDLQDCVKDVNDGNFNYLVVILDVDESTVSERIEEVKNSAAKLNRNTELIVIPQNRCIETWFLGNTKVFKQNPQNTTLAEYIQFYNVKTNDPEKMGKPDEDSPETHSQFHAAYCKAFLKEGNISYTKKFPRGVTEGSYLDELKLRIEKTSHLLSLQRFLDFCKKVESEV